VKLAVASDHAGYELCAKVVELLRGLGHDVEHLGTHSRDSVDYPDFAVKAARAVAEGRAERGVLVCGSGIGMDMAANKVHGVRAALVHDEFAAEMSRRHNDANVICLGARITTPDLAERYLKLFLGTPFEGGRHKGRVEKLDAIC
jgi:ribose 5-phosphate isomerase B